MSRTFSVVLSDDVMYGVRTAEDIKRLIAEDIAQQIVAGLSLTATIEMHPKGDEDEG